MSNTLIIYYSLEGNTKLIAEKISEKFKFDIIELKPKKQYATKGFKKYFWGGKSVIFGDKPKLINDDIDLNLYETIIIGTPIWAGTFAPPIKTILSQYKIEKKQIALFACHGGGGAEKCFNKIKQAIPNNNFIGEIDFVDPKMNNTDVNSEKVLKWVEGLKIE